MTTQTDLTHIGHFILCTALEGGIGYWARGYNIKREHLDLNFSYEDYVSAELIEFEDVAEAYGINSTWNYDRLDTLVESGAVSTILVTADMVRDHFLELISFNEGLDIPFGTRARWWGEYHSEGKYADLDAEDADMIVQHMMFGEVRYG